MKRLHYLALIGAIALGTALRFWNLDAKPLWLDEVITAIFSFGRSYYDVPLNVLFPHTVLDQVFTLKSGVSCPQIAQTVSTESVHPPLFFCLLHSWLRWINPLAQSWVWKLRSLPALFGVAAIVAIYGLNRVAYAPKAGLTAAALMAVSPFAVYLSQEARHYTLPMLLITLALLSLVQMQQDLWQSRRLRPLPWLGWMLVNGIGFYIHYFFLLAFVGQVVTLVGMAVWQRSRISRYHWGAIALAISGVVLSYLPWLPTLLGHTSRPETDWLSPFQSSWLDKLAPLYQLPAAWLIMVISFPVENQPLWSAIPAALLMLVFAIWLMRHVIQGLKQLWVQPETHLATITLTSFILCVLVEFLGIVYVLGKDITVVPRYNFVYYPAVCALLGASLTQLSQNSSLPPRMAWSHYWSAYRVQISVLVVGLLSCIFLGLGFIFQKPYQPQQVAQNLMLEPTKPLMVVTGYDTLLEVALGLSFDLEVHRRSLTSPELNQNVSFGFLSRQPTYSQLWQNLANVQPPVSTPPNLWIVGSGLRQREFPEQLSLPSQAKSGGETVACERDEENYHRIGVPYQLYRCAAR
ncbi:glycosyltransferase family 39 protein [Trichocoleus sp. FACHB-262]|uniref:glycosyltransferase family 39 protein n=1 Tax=Trichocoleus sp. FACHB-262 TaxID=2692869 RepID=UPI001687CF6C|nr:glycosyltransferase family 39 protein [Trichocoleus sp. FACHB-262]MBD2122261.1 glycosyltransferase family 39 protein [Trichocoleus sp. FACHB-262]